MFAKCINLGLYYTVWVYKRLFYTIGKPLTISLLRQQVPLMPAHFAVLIFSDYCLLSLSHPHSVSKTQKGIFPSRWFPRFSDFVAAMRKGPSPLTSLPSVGWFVFACPVNHSQTKTESSACLFLSKSRSFKIFVRPEAPAAKIACCVDCIADESAIRDRPQAPTGQ